MHGFPELPRCPVVTQSPYPIEDVPDTPIQGLGLSFRDIAIQLDGFIDQLLAFPQTIAFLANPYDLKGPSTARVEEIDRLWTRVANRFVNDHTSFPSSQWNRKITFVTNGGLVFINSQTFQERPPIIPSCLPRKE